MRLILRVLVFALLAGLVAAAVWLAFREMPVLVDLAEIERGPMAVTVTEEGVARVRDVFEVSAPVAGRIERITLEVGDRVVAGETMLARIRPLDPPFLDERARAELEAATEAARSAVALAKVEHERALTSLQLAESEFDRASRLAERNFLSESQLERAQSDVRVQKAQVRSAEANIRLREAELESALARLTQPGGEAAGDADGECCVHIMAPVDGVVLAVPVRSEQAVGQGEKLVELGDPSRLEVTVDLLSRDAVRVEAGAAATITEWGGDADIAATVRRIEPAAFTKVSALGIEEQRVNAILDLKDVPKSLGHNYRVLARLRIWSGEDVPQAPLGALFRSGGEWSLFVVEGGLARRVAVRLGHMNDRSAELLEGPPAGTRVILYPNDQLSDGRMVEERPRGE